MREIVVQVNNQSNHGKIEKLHFKHFAATLWLDNSKCSEHLVEYFELYQAIMQFSYTRGLY